MQISMQHPHTSHRDSQLDMLRGFALFIVWMINLWSLSGFRQRLQMGQLGQWEEGLYWFQAVWLDGKAYPLFALLFGMGCGWLLGKGRRFWFRRMLFLGIVGAVHLVFIWYGDILFAYALIGSVLWSVRKHTDRGLIRLAVLLISAKAWVLLPIAIWVPANVADSIGTEPLLFAGADIGDMWRANLGQLSFKLQHYLYSARPAELLGMACLGLVAQRHYLRAVRHAVRFRCAYFALGSLCAASAAAIEHAIAIFPPSAALALARGLQIPGQLGLVVGYCGFVLGASASGKWGSGIAAIGRCSFSAYLAQSFIAVLVFYGPFLGYYAQWNLWLVSIFAVAVYAVQSCQAVSLLRYLPHAPLELLWRGFSKL